MGEEWGGGIVGEGGVTMRRGGPHPCVPGVPFMILTLHSGMKGETEEERWTEGGKGGDGEQRDVPASSQRDDAGEVLQPRVVCACAFAGLCPPAGVCCLVLIQAHAFYAR